MSLTDQNGTVHFQEVVWTTKITLYFFYCCKRYFLLLRIGVISHNRSWVNNLNSVVNLFKHLIVFILAIFILFWAHDGGPTCIMI